MLCLLPPTRLALGVLTEAQAPDASGLFNLMRNLGGAIGIALIDTILYGRSGGHAEALRDRLIAGDITAARAIGLDLQLFTHRPPMYRTPPSRPMFVRWSRKPRSLPVPTKPGRCSPAWRCSDCCSFRSRARHRKARTQANVEQRRWTVLLACQGDYGQAILSRNRLV
jgi:hypothetical protein